jgi:hypothetical protein
MTTTLTVEVSTLAQQEIYCTVNSCYYYGAGDRCSASKIMVKNNPETVERAKYEIGALGDAETSNQTLCHTFVPREHGPKAGIVRIE